MIKNSRSWRVNFDKGEFPRQKLPELSKKTPGVKEGEDMGTNEKTATTETQKIRKLQPRKTQKTTEARNIKTLEVG